MAKKLIKFTFSLDKSIVYIDPANVDVIQEYHYSHSSQPSYNLNGTTASIPVPTYNSYIPIEHPDTQTIVFMHSGNKFAITEYITEVLALLQDKDPRPARVIFGKE